MENLAGASRERPSVKVLTQQALLLLATCFASPTAAAEDSANYFLEPCRAATTDNAPLSGTTFLQGVCMGQVVGIAYTAYALPAKLRSCWPKGTTHGQAVRVVVAYLDARPARLQENFLDGRSASRGLAVPGQKTTAVRVAIRWQFPRRPSRKPRNAGLAQR
jgi:Rap1a immunity proteins